jgi:acyl carrier protein
MSTMTRPEITQVLQDVFREVFDSPQLTLSDSTTASDIEGWDSLQQIKIILACEKKFKIRLRARDINALENVGQMIDHLSSALGKSNRN